MFDKAYPFVFGEEKGFVNNPSDHGGATKDGVTQAVYSEYRKKTHQPPLSVKYMKDEERYAIYKGFWIDSRADLIDEFYQDLATVHFDTAFNAGTHQAALFLQRAVHTIVDGYIGPKTLAACKSLPESNIINDYLQQRIDFYRFLARRDPTQQQFLKTWLGRVKRLRKYISPTIIVT